MKDKNKTFAYWVDDKNGSTWAYGEKVPVKVCSNCKHSCLFNLLGDPIYSNYCPHCGLPMKRRIEKNAQCIRNRKQNKPTFTQKQRKQKNNLEASKRTETSKGKRRIQ